MSTDTATLVVFDEECLRDRRDDDCDWWTGEGDLEAEEALHRLAFIDTGHDGRFLVDVAVVDRLTDEPVLKTSRLRVLSGRLLFGAGECLPGEGPALGKYLGAIELESGMYDVAAIAREGVEGIDACYAVHLVRVGSQSSA